MTVRVSRSPMRWPKLFCWPCLPKTRSVVLDRVVHFRSTEPRGGEPVADFHAFHGLGADESLSQATACGVGACAADGTRHCEAGAWIGDTCAPGASSPEACDNVDNDCDGSIDEGLAQASTCGIGACAATGTKTA